MEEIVMDYQLNFITTRLNLGALKPFKFIHITDNHSTRADERDEQKKTELARSRVPHFPHGDDILVRAREFALENNTFIAHTGDLIDFISEANYDLATEFSNSCDLFMAAGNHEYANYLGEHEDEEYRNRSVDRIQACFKNDIRFDSRIVNGINIIVADNSYHQFESWQLERLKAEVKKGLPILMFMHTPLYDEATYDYMINQLKNNCAFLMNVPDELVDLYPEALHYHHRPTEDTKRAYNYIVNEPLIKAIFAGHIHRNFESRINEGTLQFVTGSGTGRIIEIT